MNAPRTRLLLSLVLTLLACASARVFAEDPSTLSDEARSRGAARIPLYPSLTDEDRQWIDDYSQRLGPLTPKEEEHFKALVAKAQADLDAANRLEQEARNNAAKEQMRQQAERCGADCFFVEGEGKPGAVVQKRPDGSYAIGDGKTFTSVGNLNDLAEMLEALGVRGSDLRELAQKLAQKETSDRSQKNAADGPSGDGQQPSGDGRQPSDEGRQPAGGGNAKDPVYEATRRHAEDLYAFVEPAAFGLGGGAGELGPGGAGSLRAATALMTDAANRLRAEGTFLPLQEAMERTGRKVVAPGVAALGEAAATQLDDAVPVVKSPFRACEKGANCK